MCRVPDDTYQGKIYLVCVSCQSLLLYNYYTIFIYLYLPIFRELVSLVQCLIVLPRIGGYF